MTKERIVCLPVLIKYQQDGEYMKVQLPETVLPEIIVRASNLSAGIDYLDMRLRHYFRNQRY